MKPLLDHTNSIACRIERMTRRVKEADAEGVNPYLQPTDAVDGVTITIRGRKMLQFASYSYLDLIKHPKIQAAAKAALEEFGTGTHGVRLLAGTTRVHIELERTIARFKQTEDAIALSTGYGACFGAISALLDRNDVVISDKLNHASIVDGCLLSRANFVRFEHNNMESLEKVLAEAPSSAGKLVVVDAVFSMDGDITPLPEIIRLCKQHDAMLMIDEAHSLGVLGAKGRGILEHFGIEDPNAVDIQMGTLSKTIPSIGGYIAGKNDLITYLKHRVRPFIFSAALPPASAAAARASFEVIEKEPERVERLRHNTDYFLSGLKKRGFNTLNSETPIVPVITGDDKRALQMSLMAQEQGIFVLPVISPAVPPGTSRLRTTVTAGHTQAQIEQAMNVLEGIAKKVGVLK